MLGKASDCQASGQDFLMKRAVAALVLLGSVAFLVKAGFKPAPAPALKAAPSGAAPQPIQNDASQVDPQSVLLAEYPEEGALIARVAERYEGMALRIGEQAGLAGLRLLDRLDLEAIFLFEKHPAEFRTLAASVGDTAAADLLLHWRAYFGMKRADDTDRARLITEVAGLSDSQRRIASKYPHALPLILAAPSAMSDLLSRLRDDPDSLQSALTLLDLVSLESGPESLRRALEALELRPELALRAFRMRGPEGLALVMMYGDVLDLLGAEVPLEDALVLMQVNSDDIDALLKTATPSQLAAHVRHLNSARLCDVAGSSVHGLRLSVDYGREGDAALRQAGADAADIVYAEFSDPWLREQAVRSLGKYGPMAAAMLTKYSADEQFQAILKRDGADVIPPIARADVSPEILHSLQNKPRKSFTEGLATQVLSWSGENGQAVIRTIHDDGLARVAELNRTDVQFYQFLPLYDLLHLGKVFASGHSPTSGELTWAAVDAAFVVWDVLSLTAAQPGATAAGEAVRGEVKSTVKQAAKVAGREVVEEATPRVAREGAQAALSASTRAARWWAVRSAGGLYQVLKRAPEAIERMSLEQLSRMATPLCRKAGLALSAWTPRRFVRDGVATVLRVPAGRWTKYVGINVSQAGVGVVAIHKMEEHMAARRPKSPVE